MTSQVIASLSVSVLCVFSVASYAQSFDGDWQVSESVNATACGEGEYTDSYVATVLQSGSQMSVSANGINRSGTFAGGRLNYSVSFAEDGGTNTGSGSIVFSGKTATGSSSWSWTDGSLTCAGTSSISATQISSSVQEPSPAPSPTPQAEIVAPKLSYLLTGSKLDLSWTATTGAQTYTLFYAPYPSASPILTLDLGQALSVSGVLSVNDAFYIAVQANLSDGKTALSNIENFKISGVDVIEVNNTSSDISAIVFGSTGSSLTTFNGTTTTQAVLDFSAGRHGVMTGDASGRLTQLSIEGFTATIVYGLGTKQTTITAPDGTASMTSESLVSQSMLMGDCAKTQACDGAAAYAEPLETDDVSKFEQLLDDTLDTFRRISTVPFCAQPIGIATCKAVEEFIDVGKSLKERLSQRVQYNVSRIGNALNCSVAYGQCSATASKEVPAIVQQLKTNSANTMPTAGFDIGAEKVTPKEEWRDYIVNGSTAMSEVPCAESVFANMRSDCGATDTDEPEIDPDFDSVAARCWDTAADTGCVNANEFPVGIHKHYGDVNSNRYLQISDDYRGLSLLRTRYFPSGALASTVTFVYTGDASKLDGYWAEDGVSKAYYEDGTLKLVEPYKLSLRDGSTKFYNENGVISQEGNYKAGKLDGTQNSYVNGKLVSTQVYSNGVKISSTNY